MMSFTPNGISGERPIPGRLLRQHLDPGLNRGVRGPDAIDAGLQRVPREPFVKRSPVA